MPKQLVNPNVQRFSRDAPKQQFHEALADDGCCIIEQLLDGATVDALRCGIDDLKTFASRNLARNVQAVGEVAVSHAVCEIANAVLGENALLMRSILFDKTPLRNWHVGWHQDTAIAVRERIDVPDFGPWSVKAGVPHVRPPAGVLEQMLTIRLHLDDCDETNGALRVLPGQHARGYLDPEQLVAHASANGCATCAVLAGDAVLMRPLLPHASSTAKSPTRRRVVHLEFAAGSLPGGLAFHREL